MALELFAEKLPEDLRETFKQEIAKYVAVDSRDAAKQVLASNPHFVAEFQSALSLKHEQSMQKFQSEKLPTLIEEEIKKRSSKNPLELEIEKLRNEYADMQRQSVLKDRKAEAIAELSKLGLDPELADLVIDHDEESYKNKLGKLTGKVTSWRDAELKKAGISAFGQKAPTAGQPGSVDFSKMSTTEVMKFAGQSPENAAAVLQWQKSKK